MNYADTDGFYTMKGYALKEDNALSCAMEDYLEMICRLYRGGRTVRVAEIAGKLHVKPSSVTKMLFRLSEEGFVVTERYGGIFLTEKGKKYGDYLLFRHDTLNSFLCLVNSSDDELEQTEKIEHFINFRTIKNLELLIKKLRIK